MKKRTLSLGWNQCEITGGQHWRGNAPGESDTSCSTDHLQCFYWDIEKTWNLVFWKFGNAVASYKWFNLKASYKWFAIGIVAGQSWAYRHSSGKNPCIDLHGGDHLHSQQHFVLIPISNLSGKAGRNMESVWKCGVCPSGHWFFWVNEQSTTLQGMTSFGISLETS